MTPSVPPLRQQLWALRPGLDGSVPAVHDDAGGAPFGGSGTARPTAASGPARAVNLRRPAGVGGASAPRRAGLFRRDSAFPPPLWTVQASPTRSTGTLLSISIHVDPNRPK